MMLARLGLADLIESSPELMVAEMADAGEAN